MHWLLLLAVITSTTGARSGQSSAQTSKLIEDALRQKLGNAQTVRVQLAQNENTGSKSSGRAAGDFDRITVDLSGFNADRLDGVSTGTNDTFPGESSTGDSFPGEAFPGESFPSEDGNIYPPSELRTNKIKADVLGDILGGVLGGGKVSKGDIGSILGNLMKGGRIGRLQLRAKNFSYGGANYDSMSADIGEIRFDWAKALRGQMDIKSIQPGSLALQLRGDQAAKLLGPRLPRLSDVRVQFRDGRAFVGASAKNFGIRVPFEVGARLSVQQNQVRAEDFAASVSKLRLPGFVLDELTRGINPIYDFDPKNKLPLAIDLQTAGTANNALALRGGVRWLGFNRREEPRDEPEPQEETQDKPDIFDILRDR